jgi:hypothetical protein
MIISSTLFSPLGPTLNKRDFTHSLSLIYTNSFSLQGFSFPPFRDAESHFVCKHSVFYKYVFLDISSLVIQLSQVEQQVLLLTQELFVEMFVITGFDCNGQIFLRSHFVFIFLVQRVI